MINKAVTFEEGWNVSCHVPVMVNEVVEYLLQEKDGIYVDGTLGCGGHAYEVLKKITKKGRLIGIDWDEDAIEIAGKRLNTFSDRLTIWKGNFADIKKILTKLQVHHVNGILLDLGLSTIHLERKGRGFSFLQDEALDMRMDRGIKRSACNLINELTEGELTEIFWEYGEERWAKRIAREICKRRKKKKISTTKELADIIFFAIPAFYRSKRIHPATRIFQALRIAVNDELGNLKKGIYEGVDVLRPSGRLCIISYHSLEDRVVKGSFKELERGCICPSDIPRCVCGMLPKIKVLTKGVLRPSLKEISENPKARSARLRVAERIN